jgi:hypothetical protein
MARFQDHVVNYMSLYVFEQLLRLSEAGLGSLGAGFGVRSMLLHAGHGTSLRCISLTKVLVQLLRMLKTVEEAKLLDHP